MAKGFPDYQPFDVPVQIASGGTGSTTGSILGPTALTFQAGGSNQNVNLIPSGSGRINLGGPVLIGGTIPSGGLQSSEVARVEGTVVGGICGLGLLNTDSGGEVGIVFWGTPAVTTRAWIRASSATAGLILARTAAGTDLVIDSSGNVQLGGTLQVGGGVVSSPGALQLAAGGSNQNVTLTPSGTGACQLSGVVAIGSPVLTGAATGEIVLANAKEIRGVNAAGTNADPMMSYGIDGNTNVADVVRLGYSGAKQVMLYLERTTGFPVAGAAQDGLLYLDSTNNRLVFYVGGNRYYVAGTAF